MNTSSLNATLHEHLDRLAAFAPVPFPFISLYLNTSTNQQGRTQFQQFVRKEFAVRSKSFLLRSSNRESFDADHHRIQTYLDQHLPESANGLAIFACSAADGFFETIPLEPPIREHRLFVTDRPHLYPLARLHDQYPRYAVALIDRQSARLFVIGLGEILLRNEITGSKINRTATGGWSQARYQRHVDNFQLQHSKEVVQVLDRIVNEEEIDKVVLAGDEATLSIVRQELPTRLSDMIIDVKGVEVRALEKEILTLTSQAVRDDDAKSDERKVERLLNEFRSGGLGVVGAKDTLSALTNGQVDELLLSASRADIRGDGQEEKVTSGGGRQVPILADVLVASAHQTAARVTFIEDPRLLECVGGVGALLRYRL